MKVPIDAVACIDLDAPTIAAHEVKRGGVTRWRFWCRHCGQWHYHGPAEGHREAHCTNPASPYHATGYNLALAVASKKTPEAHNPYDPARTETKRAAPYGEALRAIIISDFRRHRFVNLAHG